MKIISLKKSSNFLDFHLKFNFMKPFNWNSEYPMFPKMLKKVNLPLYGELFRMLPAENHKKY